MRDHSLFLGNTHWNMRSTGTHYLKCALRVFRKYVTYTNVYIYACICVSGREGVDYFCNCSVSLKWRFSPGKQGTADSTACPLSLHEHPCRVLSHVGRTQESLSNFSCHSTYRQITFQLEGPQRPPKSNLPGDATGRRGPLTIMLFPLRHSVWPCSASGTKVRQIRAT